MRNRETFHRNQNVLQNIYNIVKFIKKKIKIKKIRNLHFLRIICYFVLFYLNSNYIDKIYPSSNILVSKNNYQYFLKVYDFIQQHLSIINKGKGHLKLRKSCLIRLSSYELLSLIKLGIFQTSFSIGIQCIFPFETILQMQPILKYHNLNQSLNIMEL